MTFELARMGLYWNASVEASALSEDKLRVNSRQALNLSTNDSEIVNSNCNSGGIARHN